VERPRLYATIERAMALIADFRPHNGDLLAALHKVQHEYGYLSREALEVIGEQLELYERLLG
jgi:NADH:ubiquinone oxidoreductase subunit E